MWSTEIIFALVFVVAFLVALPIYLTAERKSSDGQREFNKAAALKLTVSGICALCALLGFFLWGMHRESTLILIPIALLCSVVGDYFLQFIALDERKFKIGIFFFALTQVFLCIFLILQHGISWPEFAIAVGVVVGTWLMITLLKWELGGAKYPLLAYTGILIFVASKAVLALFASVSIPLPVSLMAAGMGLFVISDSLLGIRYYSGAKKSKSLIYLITYFFAILFIALSSLF